LVWPVSSFNPYSNGLETDLRYADDAGLALALQPLEISRLAIEIPPPVAVAWPPRFGYNSWA